jgi:hypothetical protein
LRDCCDPHRAEELAAGQRRVLVVVGLAIAGLFASSSVSVVRASAAALSRPTRG